MGQYYTFKPTAPRIELVPVCPKCRGSIYWSLHSGLEGAQSYANCSNNPSATRVIINPHHMIMCDWEGIVRRTKNGNVNIFNKDGTRVPHRVVRHFRND